jgi:polyhydroxyalkanoate synthesis regulator phasin
MRGSTKLKFIGASVAALAVAGGGAAIAATKVWSPREESQAVIDDAAKQLGVTPSELSDALKQALKNRVDDALADGRLTKAQADELKERIDSSDIPLPLGLFGLGFPPKAFDLKGFGFVGPFAKLDTAADYLGLSRTELRAKLAQGKTLAEIARSRGKSVDGLVDALVKSAEDKIDAAVDAGKLTKAQADDVKSGLRERMTDLVNGAFRLKRGPGSFFAPGFRFGHPDLLPGRPRFDRDFWPRRGASA